jgi:hypothetical protein
VTTQRQPSLQPRYIQQAIQRHLQPPHVTEEWLVAGGIAVDCSRSLNSPVTSDSTGGQTLADVRTRYLRNLRLALLRVLTSWPASWPFPELSQVATINARARKTSRVGDQPAG